MAKKRVPVETPEKVEPATGVRERILDAAVSVLGSSGLGKLAQPHIAKVAGVAQGHLTYYFPKKNDLLSALVTRFVDLLREDLPANLREEVGGRVDVMRARTLRMAGSVVKNRARMRMLLGLVVATEEDPSLRETMAENLVLVRSLVARFMGKPAKDPDVEIALAMLWGIGLQHLVLEGRRSEAETDRVLERLEDWLAAIPPQAEKPKAASAKK